VGFGIRVFQIINILKAAIGGNWSNEVTKGVFGLL